MKLMNEGVILAGLDLRMRPALVTADNIYKTMGQELVVTCGLDGLHSAGSLHYYGLAIDIRNRFFTDTEKARVLVLLRDALGCSFQVAEHTTHIHIEYDF